MGITEWNNGYIIGSPSVNTENQTVFYNLSYIKIN